MKNVEEEGAAAVVGAVINGESRIGKLEILNSGRMADKVASLTVPNGGKIFIIGQGKPEKWASQGNTVIITHCNCS